MTMVCAQCNQTYEPSMRVCPLCNIQLLVQHRQSAGKDADPLPAIDDDPMRRWQQTPWGRITVSVMLAQGLAFTLQLMCNAWWSAGGAAGDARWWRSLDGLLWQHGFHAFSLFFAGMLAGANQQRGATTGAIVGLLNGLIFFALHRSSRDVMDPAYFFGQPFLHMFFGGVGGLVGYRIWKPVPVLGMDDSAPVTPVIPFRSLKRLLRGPIHIWRVLLGVAIVLLGVLFANEILTKIIIHSEGTLSIRSHFAEKLARLQIAGFFTIAGAMLAGATTTNGFKQGLCVGIIAASLFLGAQFANPKAVLEMTLFTIAGIFGLSLLGGMFGRALFPPLAPNTKKAIPY